MKNQVFNINALALVVLIVSMLGATFKLAAQTSQSDVRLEQVRWKSEQQVRNLLGEPASIKGPVGTHASYTLWQYSEVTVVFANKRAFHLFRNDSLRKPQLDSDG